MSESPVLPVLFTQLQARYPTSGLLTELVQMDADRCVVRALVQFGSMTLATSMATAATVEQAEDQARLRVLALLGIHATLPFSVPDVAVASHSASSQTVTNALQDTTLVVNALHNVAPRGTLSTTATLPELEPIAPPFAFPTVAFEPTATIAPTPVAAVESYPTAPAVAEPEPEIFDEPPDMDMDDVSYNAATYEEEPFEEHKPPVENASDDRATANITAAAEPVVKSKPRKPGTDKAPAASAIATPESESKTSEESSNPSNGSPSRDLSSLISQIGVEIDRIGWSKRQGSTYLQKTYGKKTRSELTDDELEDFLTYLNTQPSAGGVGSEE